MKIMDDNKNKAAPQAGFSGVTRKILERVRLPGDPRELFVVEVTYPPAGPCAAAPPSRRRRDLHRRRRSRIRLSRR
jgi:hypothetical protein